MARELTYWSKPLLVETIRRLNDEGVDLRYSKVSRTHYKVLKAATYHFGTWKRAVTGAGIDYRKYRAGVLERKREVRRQELLTNLRRAFETGVELDVTSVIRHPQYKTYYWQAKTLYSGETCWEQALTDAGIDFKNVVRQQVWTRKKVMDEIERRKIEGLPLNAGSIHRDSSGLLKAMKKYFGSHDEALTACGINPERVRKLRNYTDEEILEGIKGYASRGVDLSCNSKIKPEIRRLYFAATKRFGGWNGALRAAGLEHLSKKRRWSLERVKQAILELHSQGQSLNGSSIGQSLYKAAVRRFGSWEKALESLEIDYSTHHPNYHISDEGILESIRRLDRQGQDLSTTAMTNSDNFQVRKLYSQGSSRFPRGWAGAVTQAGLDYDEIRQKPKYSYQELVDAVLELHSQGRSLEAVVIMKDPERRYLHKAVARRFHSWYVFLDRIGIDSSEYKTQTDWRNGETVVERLRERFPSGIVTGIRKDNNTSVNLMAAICKHFGTLKAACKRAGMIYSRFGEITRNVLRENPNLIDTLYLHNRQFIEETARKFYFWARRKGIRTIDEDDLIQEAAVIFCDVVAKKPKGRDLREFATEEMFRRLASQNRDSVGREILWGDAVYFDLFRDKTNDGGDEIAEHDE